MTDPSRLLRDYAESCYPAGDPRRLRLAALADALEQQHNQQNNNWTGALGMAELAIEDRIAAAVRELRAEMASASAQRRQILVMLEVLQEEVHRLQDGDNAQAAGDGQ